MDTLHKSVDFSSISYLLGLVTEGLPGLKALAAPRLKMRVARVLRGAMVMLQNVNAQAQSLHLLGRSRGRVEAKGSTHSRETKRQAGSNAFAADRRHRVFDSLPVCRLTLVYLLLLYPSRRRKTTRRKNSVVGF